MLENLVFVIEVDEGVYELVEHRNRDLKEVGSELRNGELSESFRVEYFLVGVDQEEDIFVC